jgi:hypothetical protein
MLFNDSLLYEKAIARDIGPILPRYIVQIIISLPHKFKKGVRFLVSPTVAVALTVSYNTSSIDASVTADSSIVEINIIENDITVTATAFRVTCFDNERLNTLTSFLFVISAYAVKISTAIVTVLIPPAVPTGDPPINISISEIIALVSVKFS